SLPGQPVQVPRQLPVLAPELILDYLQHGGVLLPPAPTGTRVIGSSHGRVRRLFHAGHPGLSLRWRSTTSEDNSPPMLSSRTQECTPPAVLEKAPAAATGERPGPGPVLAGSPRWFSAGGGSPATPRSVAAGGPA